MVLFIKSYGPWMYSAAHNFGMIYLQSMMNLAYICLKNFSADKSESKIGKTEIPITSPSLYLGEVFCNRVGNDSYYIRILNGTVKGKI